jgi:Na+-translocating ferredoxin:NAD+ oxidoreductase RnfD subunit
MTYAGAPLWAACVSLTAALVLGKAVWGGTGRNPLNPAMVGVLLLALIAPGASSALESTLLLLPGAVLSLPFLLVRPYAGAGMILGMAAALLARGGFSVAALLRGGVFFWGCLVITDPVTTTARPVPGFTVGALAGFVPLMTDGAALAMPLGILAANVLSYLSDRFLPCGGERLRRALEGAENRLLAWE